MLTELATLLAESAAVRELLTHRLDDLAAGDPSCNPVDGFIRLATIAPELLDYVVSRDLTQAIVHTVWLHLDHRIPLPLAAMETSQRYGLSESWPTFDGAQAVLRIIAPMLPDSRSS